MKEDMEAHVVAVFKRHMANPDTTTIRVEGYKSSNASYRHIDVKCLPDGGYLGLVEKSLELLGDDDFCKLLKKMAAKMGVEDFEGTRSELVSSFKRSLESPSKPTSSGAAVWGEDYHLQRKKSAPDALYLTSLKKVAAVYEEEPPVTGKDKDRLTKCLPIGQYLAMLKLDDGKFSNIRLIKDETSKGDK